MSDLRWLVIAVALFMPARPGLADNAKTAYHRGVEAERKTNLDEAFRYYRQAYGLAPSNPRYFAAYARVRFSAAARHLHNGQLLRNTGANADALAEFQRAVEIDSSSFVAQQELRRTADMIRKQERQRNTPKSEPPPRGLDQVADSIELRPLSTASITFHMTANADVAYKTICRIAGLNVIVDQDFRPQKISVELKDVTLQEALDIVKLQSRSFWRPVSPNTIFVAQDSPAKRKEIEQNVMKTFYLENVSAPAELQEAGNMLRQILDIARVHLLPQQDAIIVRGTPDQMVLAEKLLADFDKPRSEVVIDVAVMQVTRDNIRTIGANLPTSASVGYVGTDSGSGSGGNAQVGLNALSKLSAGNFAVSVPGASFTALASDSNTKILQSPEIRAINNEKATLRIGDRVPIATGSFQPGIIGAGGVSPLVSTQFTYLDVGVNIDITPHIHPDGDVTLKMALEISSVTGSENIGGITQPVIGQRRIEHETRVADGEVNLIGGILDDSETKSLSGYPYLSRIPILKYLFAQDNRERREDEIIFAITPHMVRTREVTADNRRAIEVGTGNSTELRRKQTAPAAEKTAADATKSAPTAANTTTGANASDKLVNRH